LSSFESDLLKQKYDGAIKSLYNGTQCAQCGNRFNQQQLGDVGGGGGGGGVGQAAQSNSSSSRYSKHLDWHFRQNKRDKEEVNKAHSRNWFYSLTEWIFYEEISEEVEMQQQQQQASDSQQTAPHYENGIDVDDLDMSGGGQQSGENAATSGAKTTANADGSSAPGRQQLGSYMHNGSATCQASDDIGDSCCICGDPFEIFYIAEKEEWHFKDALRVENRLYHPICYEDASDVGVLLNFSLLIYLEKSR
jgi:pre-mRNA cleavage complex 2 protein Pcf11